MSRFVDKWTAFWLSLFVPGAGQLAAGSWTWVAWLTGAVLACTGCVALHDATKSTSLQLSLALAMIGAASAEHARRLFDPKRSEPVHHRGAPRVRSSVRTRPAHGRAIRTDMVFEVPRDHRAVWDRIADLTRFLTVDPFHERVVLMRGRPAAGVDLALYHNAFGRRSLRLGRILRWQEGIGFAFSDLSRRGSGCDFPHVFFVAVQADPGRPNQARVTIKIRGKWTSRVVPIWAGRGWVRLVCWEHARLLCKAL